MSDDQAPGRVGFTKEQRQEMADAPSLMARMVLRAQRECVTNSDRPSFGWRRNIFLILLQTATRGLPLETIKAFGWFAPEAMITSRGHVVTLYRPPGPLGDPPKSLTDTSGDLVAVDLGPDHDLAGRIVDLAQRENATDEQVNFILTTVFQGWVKNDERPGRQRGASQELRRWAQQFALKPGEREKTEEQRDKDGY